LIIASCEKQAKVSLNEVLTKYPPVM